MVVLPAPLGPSTPKTSPRRDGQVDGVDGALVAERLDEAVASTASDESWEGVSVPTRGGGGGG